MFKGLVCVDSYWTAAAPRPVIGPLPQLFPVLCQCRAVCTTSRDIDSIVAQEKCSRRHV